MKKKKKIDKQARKIKKPTLKKRLIFREMELDSPIKLNETPLRETGYLSNH